MNREDNKSSMEKEIWKDIEIYEGRYQVSNIGRVKSLKNDKYRILNPSIWDSPKGGYCVVVLYDKELKTKKFRVHRLVAKAFLKANTDLPQVNHIDGVKTNNRVENLEFCTQKENVRHAFALGLRGNKPGEDSANHKLTNIEVMAIRVMYATKVYTQNALAEMFGVTFSNVWRIVHRKTWKHLKI